MALQCSYTGPKSSTINAPRNSRADWQSLEELFLLCPTSWPLGQCSSDDNHHDPITLIRVGGFFPVEACIRFTHTYIYMCVCVPTQTHTYASMYTLEFENARAHNPRSQEMQWIDMQTYTVYDTAFLGLSLQILVASHTSSPQQH